MEIHTYPDGDSLALAAADHFTDQAVTAISSRSRFAVALSGGSTPRTSYGLLASDSYLPKVDWRRVHLFFGDERCVPPDHPESNYRMVRETLVDHIPIPGENVHRIQGEIEPEEAADDYEKTMRSFFGSNSSFDLVLLGMGIDGHTASLFPGTGAIREHDRWVVAHHIQNLGVWRISLTPAIINGAETVTFIVSGKNKAEMAKRVLEGPLDPKDLPAQIIRPARGKLYWLLDAEAASRLERRGKICL